MVINYRTALLGILLVTLAAPALVAGQGTRDSGEKKPAPPGPSASPPEGEHLWVGRPYDETYGVVLDYLKRHGYALDSADKETGRIVTALAVEGGRFQTTGTRVYVTVIKGAGAITTVRVAVMEQKRKKLFRTGEWSEPQVNYDKSAKLADDLREALK